MDGHSMSINWSTCHSSGRIDSYMVIYESLYTLNMECQWIISGRNSSTVVNNLDPLLSYRVYVIGYNSAGIEANNNSVIVPRKLLSTYKRLCEIITQKWLFNCFGSIHL